MQESNLRTLEVVSVAPHSNVYVYLRYKPLAQCGPTIVEYNTILADSRGRIRRRHHGRGSNHRPGNRAGQSHVGNLVPAGVSRADGQVRGAEGVGHCARTAGG